MWEWLTPILGAVGELAAFCIFVVVVTTVRRILRQRAGLKVGRRVADDDYVCLRCGYSLRGLTKPRCPECGTLKGFDKPMSELGLSEADIRSRPGDDGVEH